MSDERGSYADYCDEVDAHLQVQAGVLGRFRSALLEQGFPEAAAATLVAVYWQFALHEADEDPSTP